MKYLARRSIQLLIKEYLIAGYLRIKTATKLKFYLSYYVLVHTLGWSDLALFSIFENVHISADQVYFQALHLKNRQFRVFILNNSQGP